jgi:hypothetical protein
LVSSEEVNDMPAAVIDNARRTKPRTTAGLHELLHRVEGEYRELPALSLTPPQAQRLWGLDSTTCAFVLTTLLARGVLRRTASGTYVLSRASPRCRVAANGGSDDDSVDDA